MERIVGSSEMKALDAFTIQEKGVPSLVLMERAAMAVKEELEKSFDPGPGTGGVRIGQQRRGRDRRWPGCCIWRAIRAEILLAGKKESFTEETGIQWKIAENYGVPVVKNPRVLSEYTTIVDAVFGVGLSRRIQGHYGELLGTAGGIRRTGSGSGYSFGNPREYRTGDGNGSSRQADRDLCDFPRTGLLLYPGAEYAGQSDGEGMWESMKMQRRRMRDGCSA